MDCYALLKKLQIPYEEVQHPVGTNTRSLALAFSDLEKYIAYVEKEAARCSRI